MKAFNDLNNVERAKLLFQLFPAEIPSLIEFTKEHCKNIIADETSIRKQWQPNSIFTFDFWLALIKDIIQMIEQDGNKLSKNSLFFSDQLFGGYTCLAMCNCMLEHAGSKQQENPNYSLAVNLFFSYK